MRSHKPLLLTALAIILLAGCAFPGESTQTISTPEETEALLPPPSETSEPEPTEELFSSPRAGFIAFDFVARMCDATWSNSVLYIPCPGDSEVDDEGYVLLLDEVMLDTETTIDLPSLLTVVPQGTNFGGIFGHYPSFTVQAGDQFRTVLGCMHTGGLCNVDFELQYFDTYGNFQRLNFGSTPWPFSDISVSDEPYLVIQEDLTPLAGQTVEFTLVVRDQDDEGDDLAVWVAPYIWRDPSQTSSLS